MPHVLRDMMRAHCLSCCLMGKLDEDGIEFDGSGVAEWQPVNQSDMLLIPQPETAVLDSFADLNTISLICNVHNPITGVDYSRDPRNIARKAEIYLKSTGLADTVCVGPGIEFTVFDAVRFDQQSHECYYHVASIGGAASAHGDDSLMRRALPLSAAQSDLDSISNSGAFDPGRSLVNQMMQRMIEAGMKVDCQRHIATVPGQAEIVLQHLPLVQMADAVMRSKYIVRNVASRHGKRATFMPKPLFGGHGVGMHTHISLWRDGQPLFAGTGEAGLSDLALHAIGGLLKHAPAVMAFTNSTTNSYKRLVPGREAPVQLAYSAGNRTAACRIPVHSADPRRKRVEFRCPDPSCNPYLAFSAILMAMIDGIVNKVAPPEPLNTDLHQLPSAEAATDVGVAPGSLAEALDALATDHEFLLADDVFTGDVVEAWIAHKRENEVDALRLRPHPYEFCMYFDV